MSEQSQPIPRQPTPDCLIDGCPNPGKTRGLCGTCYAMAARTVKAGTLWIVEGETVRVTWEWLENLGLAKPMHKNTPRPTGIFTAQMGAKMQALGAERIVPPSPPAPRPSISPSGNRFEGELYLDDPAQLASTIPGPEAAHATCDGPPPPIARTCPVPATGQQPYKALVPVDPTTGRPYLQPSPPGQPTLAIGPPPPAPIAMTDGPLEPPPGCAPTPIQASAPASVPLPWQR